MGLISIEYIVDDLLFGQPHQVIATRPGLCIHLQPIIDIDLSRHAAAEHGHRRLDDGHVVMEIAERIHRDPQQRLLETMAVDTFSRMTS